jgi:hypothetical protein
VDLTVNPQQGSVRCEEALPVEEGRSQHQQSDSLAAGQCTESGDLDIVYLIFRIDLMINIEIELISIFFN